MILEYNDCEQTYSDNWWEKLKHGTAAYGVFWNTAKENGLGDVDIKEIDLLKLFWEPAITDIQKSRNLFIVELVDEDLQGKARGNAEVYHMVRSGASEGNDLAGAYHGRFSG